MYKILIPAILCSFTAFSQAVEIDASMIFVKGGTFQMGSMSGKADERPVHTVKLNDFYIGKYEVTQALWEQVMGTKAPNKGEPTDCPVYDVNPDAVETFISTLNKLTGKHFRLPTEAEWEYAATGGSKSNGYKYSGSNNLDEVAWHAPNADMKTHPVGQKKPNELGLFDMSGNVWELCADWYQRNYYKHSAAENPVQNKKTRWRVVRGGSWRSGEQRCQSRARNIDISDHHISNGGFRLVMDVSTTTQNTLPPNLRFTSWVDSMDSYARNVYLPAAKYKWTWQNAALLNVMVKAYDLASPADKAIYFDYIKKAMDKSSASANGRMPNAVASGLGMAFLYRITGEEKYKAKCDKIYRQYLQSKRTKDGAVSHIPVFSELWDDTVFMIGEFLLGMYRATSDEKYLDELARQIALHREKLLIPEWGLWVHGWDQSGWGHCLFCSEIGWADKTSYRSPEIWGRGNGWIMVTLSDALAVTPKSNPHWNKFAGYLKEMVWRLPEMQDKKTGHWFQLPTRHTDPKNFIESSCTAMFAYGLNTAVRLGLVTDEKYMSSVEMAYTGLRNYSVSHVRGEYLTSNNVCSATCIGGKNYYFKRSVQKGKAYGLASFIQFGLAYEVDKKYRANQIK